MPSSLANKLIDFTQNQRFILLVLLGTFLVRLPSLFEPFWYGDEAIYMVIGQKILHGGLLYVDIFDHKTPGIYYLAAAALKLFGQSIWSFRFLLMVWVLITLVVFYRLALRLLEKRYAQVATALLALLLSTPLFEGNIANSEILMLLPISIGFIFGLKKRYFWSGFFFSLALLLKFPAIFDFAAFFIFVLLSAEKRNWKRKVGDLALLSCGYIVPLAASALYFVYKGAFGAYLYAALLYNKGYVDYGNNLKISSFDIHNGQIILKGLPILALVIFLLWRHLRHWRTKGLEPSSFELIVLWLGFAYYGAVFGGRPYPHYLIQPIAAFALLIAYSLKKGGRRWLAFGISVALVLVTWWGGFRPNIRPNYYPNFFRYVTNNISTQDYLNSFDAKTSRNYALAAFLDSCESDQPQNCQNTRTTSADNIYIWGDTPVIYFLAQRDPTSKYITAFHVEGNQKFKDEVITSIVKREPKYILVETSTQDFPELDKVLASRYNLFAQTDDVKIYQLVRNLTSD